MVVLVHLQPYAGVPPTVSLLKKRDSAQRAASVASSQVTVSHFLSHTACLRSSMSEADETVVS